MASKKEQFYALQIPCPDCEEDLYVADVEFSVIGGIKMELVCVSCKKAIDLISSWEKIIYICAQADQIQDEVKKSIVPSPASKLQ
jgi:DNA-directed RNA polymerase subunit RPC12/RpoP